MLTVLALDTATDFCSVALAYEGHITAQHVELPRAHNRHILNMVDTVLAAKQLSDIDTVGAIKQPREVFWQWWCLFGGVLAALPAT